MKIRANVNEPNPLMVWVPLLLPTVFPLLQDDVACVWRGSRLLDLLGWSLFRVLKLNCSTEAQRNLTFYPSNRFSLSFPLFFSLSLSHSLTQSCACWSDKCVCDLCGGEFSCHCHLCLFFSYSSSSTSSTFCSCFFSKRVVGGREAKRFFNTIPNPFCVGRRTKCNATMLQVSTPSLSRSLPPLYSLFYFWYFNKLSDDLMGSSWV